MEVLPAYMLQDATSTCACQQVEAGAERGARQCACTASLHKLLLGAGLRDPAAGINPDNLAEVVPTAGALPLAPSILVSANGNY